MKDETYGESPIYNKGLESLKELKELNELDKERILNNFGGVHNTEHADAIDELKELAKKDEKPNKLENEYEKL